MFNCFTQVAALLLLLIGWMVPGPSPARIDSGEAVAVLVAAIGFLIQGAPALWAGTRKTVRP